MNLMSLNLDFTNFRVAIVNIVIILLIVLATIDSYKKGLFDSVIKFLGFIIACVVAFTFKNKLSVLMYTYLPFFKFGGSIKGVTAINILLYELIAFLIIYIVAKLVINLIIKMTGIIDRLVKLIPIIGFIDQLLGAIVGFIDAIVVLYLVIFIFKFGCNMFGVYVKPSLADNIMEIPILNDKFGSSLSAFDDIIALKDDYNSSEADVFNNKAIKILLDKNVLTQDNLDLLIKKKKITYNP